MNPSFCFKPWFLLKIQINVFAVESFSVFFCYVQARGTFLLHFTVWCCKMLEATHLHLSAVKCYRPAFEGGAAPLSSYNKPIPVKFTITITGGFVRIIG